MHGVFHHRTCCEFDDVAGSASGSETVARSLGGVLDLSLLEDTWQQLIQLQQQGSLSSSVQSMQCKQPCRNQAGITLLVHLCPLGPIQAHLTDTTCNLRLGRAAALVEKLGRGSTSLEELGRGEAELGRGRPASSVELGPGRLAPSLERRLGRGG